MRINVAVPEAHVTPAVLNAALEGVTRLDQDLLRSGAVPTFDDAVDSVRWRPEPPGQEHFDHAGTVLGRGWGDCDDLGPWHAASLRVTGEDRGARAVVRRSGPKRWHVVVRRSDGSVDDPSLDAGMPGPGMAHGVRGAVQPPMFGRARVHGPGIVGGTYIPSPALALRPVQDRHGRPESWQARSDLPWHWQPGKGPADVAMVSLHQSPVTDQALVGCIAGAIRLGEASGYAHPHDLDRMAAIRDCLEGATWEELAEEYGEDHATAAGEVVGSFFGKIFKGIKKVAKTVAKPAAGIAMRVARTALKAAPGAVSFIPGVGPVASMALRAASPALKKALASHRHRPPHLRPAHVRPHYVRPAGARVFRPAPGVAPHRHVIYTSPAVVGFR